MGDERRTALWTGFYLLPLFTCAGVGFFVGRFIGIGGIAGMFIGAFVFDALQGLPGTRRLASELRQVFSR